MQTRAHTRIILLWPLALVALAPAQTSRPALSNAQAQRLELTLKRNPKDRAARKALLDYYFLNSSLDPATAIPARRGHILWLIENTPSDDLAGASAATIDPSGHRLADPQGFKLASDAWRVQAAKAGASPATLANAAYFFRLSDKTTTIALLERALALEPANKEISGSLGESYAMAIMGVTMVNRNGYPLGSDRDQTESPAARKSYDALSASRNPYLLAVAGYKLSFQGAILRGTGRLAFDPAPLAESVLQRAVTLAPSDRDVLNYMQQHREIQRQLRATARR